MRQQSPSTMRRFGRFTGYLLFWTAIGLFFAVQSVLTYSSSGRPVRWDAPLVWQLGYWYTWALFAPLIHRVAKRFPLDRGTWRTAVPVLLAITVVIAPVQVAVSTVVRAKAMSWAGVLTTEQAAARMAELPSTLITGSFDAAFTLWMILGVIYAFLNYRKVRESEIASSQLQAQLAEARLSNLQAQIRPHFLFNTLNSISALVSEDPEAAERMIARLSCMLRLTLDSGDSQFVPVQDEIRLVELYLEIERVRYEDRLDVSVDVEPDVLDAHVPALIFQPFVENAVKHGVAALEEAGLVDVRIRRKDDRMIFDVSDSGAGFDQEASEPTGSGIGLSNTRARLDQLFGSDWSITTRRQNGRFTVRLDIPYESNPGSVA